MERSALLALLKRVAPALGGDGPATILGCFCFTKGLVGAYNERVAVIAPAVLGGEKVPLEGCVPGALLLPLLGASTAKEVKVLELSEDKVRLKVGRSKVWLSVLPSGDFPFPVETGEADSKAAGNLGLPAEFWPGLKAALLCIDAPKGEAVLPTGMTGVLIDMAGAKKAVLYSTNSTTAARVELNLSGSNALKGSVTNLSGEFCALLSAQPEGDLPPALRFTDTGVFATTGDGIKLCGRLVAEPEVEPFRDLFGPHGKDKFTPLPKSLPSCLERAAVVVAAGGGPATDFTFEEGKLTLRTDSSVGVVRDVLKLTGYKGTAWKVRCPPERVARLLGITDRFSVSSHALLLRGDNVAVLVAVVPG